MFFWDFIQFGVLCAVFCRNLFMCRVCGDLLCDLCVNFFGGK